MRISKLMMPALTLAGALALAGCGGGSDTPAAVTPPSDDMKDRPVTQPATKTLKLPEDTSLGQTTAPVPQVYVVEVDETRDFSTTTAMLFLTCKGDTDCTITIPAGTSVTTISYTGGTLEHSKTDPRSTERAGNTERPAAEADPLSAETIAEALKTEGRKATIWASAAATGGNINHFDSTVTVTTLAGETIELTLDGNAALHWGNWIKYRGASTVGGSRTGESVGQFFGGTTARYGRKPETDIATANYGTDGTPAADVVNLQYKEGSGNWMGDEADTADLVLQANFRAGKIGGEIRGVTSATAADFPDVITLKETDITAAGTFDGDAEFKTVAADRITRKSGDWEGAFFGPATETSDNNGVRVQDHAPPSHAAGKFSVAGRHGTGSAAKNLHVRGAFGAACSSGC